MSKDFAALIDRARLQEAIASWRMANGPRADSVHLLCDAAEAHLASLPEPKPKHWRYSIIGCGIGAKTANCNADTPEQAVDVARILTLQGYRWVAISDNGEQP